MAAKVVPSPTFRIRLRNSTDKDADLWIEPLGDHVVIPKHSVIEVCCTKHLGYPIELELSDNALSIHGWVQTISEVNEDASLRPLWSLPDA